MYLWQFRSHRSVWDQIHLPWLFWPALLDGLGDTKPVSYSEDTEMKLKIAGAAATIAAAATIGLAAPANAAPPPRTGCPSGFETRTVDYVLTFATPGFEDAIRAEDRNEDNLLCFKLLPPQVPLFDPTFFFQDNEFPVR